MNPETKTASIASRRLRRATLCLPLLIGMAVPAAWAATPAADDGLALIEALGRMNGQALACHQPGVAQRAKSLVLKHAPRTARFGSAFEQATHGGYLDQVKSGACPSDLAVRMEALSGELARTLPAVE